MKITHHFKNKTLCFAALDFCYARNKEFGFMLAKDVIVYGCKWGRCFKYIQHILALEGLTESFESFVNSNANFYSECEEHNEF